nr:hypothetical protein [Tanacetum cinerariifolium]
MGLALSHKSRHASRPLGVELIVHFAHADSVQQSGSQFVHINPHTALALVENCDGYAFSWLAERRAGGAGVADARVVVMATG